MEQNNFLPDLSVGSILSQAWKYTKKHFAYFLLLMIVLGMLGEIPGAVFYGDYYSMMLEQLSEQGTVLTEEEWLQSYPPAELLSMVGKMFVALIVVFFITQYLNLVQNRMLIDVVEKDKVDFQATLKDGFRGFWFFLLCNVIYNIVIAIGTLCCVIPGIYLGVRLMYVPLIAAQHPELSLGDVFSRSMSITKGHFGELLLLGIFVLAFNFAGLLCCCIGMLVTLIVTYFIFAETYHRLSNKNDNTEDITLEKSTDNYSTRY